MAAIYPDVLSGVPCGIPFDVTTQTSTVVSTFANGRELRRTSKLVPKRLITLKYVGLNLQQMTTLREFYQARSGQYESFSFRFPVASIYTDEYITIANGMNIWFKIPCVGCGLTAVIYGDGVPFSPQPTIWEDALDGCDLIEFVTPPPEGTRMTVNFSGTPVWRMRFNDDALAMSSLLPNITDIEITLIETPYERDEP